MPCFVEMRESLDLGRNFYDSRSIVPNAKFESRFFTEDKVIISEENIPSQYAVIKSEQATVSPNEHVVIKPNAGISPQKSVVINSQPNISSDERIVVTYPKKPISPVLNEERGIHPLNIKDPDIIGIPRTAVARRSIGHTRNPQNT